MTVELKHFFQIDSTNEEAKRLAKNLNPKEDVFMVITADEQLNGRGQKNRAWYSAKDEGLYYSCLFTPNTLTEKDLEQYSLKIGRVVSNAINDLTGLSTTVEWPNDILLDDKKCGGVLIETHSLTHATQPDFVIIGIGLNLNQTTFPPLLKHVAISLRQKTQKVYNKDAFITVLTKELEACR